MYDHGIGGHCPRLGNLDKGLGMAVLTGNSRIYQATDLAGSGRRSFLEEAKGGVARLRDPDGASLVMLPESTLAALSELRGHFLAYLSLENALQRARHERRPTDFGELAWADCLDDEDLAEFRDEYRDALTRAATAQELVHLEETLEAWMLTAELLRDREAMSRINGRIDEDVREVPRPEEGT